MEKRDVGIIILLLFFFGTLYSFQQYCGNVAPAYDLRQLADAPIDTNSPTTQELLDSQFWETVKSEWSGDVVQILPQTVLGFINSSEDWRSWALANFPDPPGWLTTGPTTMLDSQINGLQVLSLGASTGSIGAIAIKQYAATIAGVSLAAVDVVAFNGASSLLTYFETGDANAAFCASGPGQLGQLYREAFDSTIPTDQRAHYLGKALAITSIIALAAGADGISSKFQDAIDAGGLGSTWDTIKPYIAKLGAVSAQVSAVVFTVLETVAQKFPADASWAVPFTAERITDMTDVMHGSGVPLDEIQQQVTGLVQAADNAVAPDEVATDSDVASYEVGGYFMVKLSNENQMLLYDDMVPGSVPIIEGGKIYVKASFLQDVVPGFKAGQAVSLKVYYPDGSVFYQRYEGGKNWVPTAPSSEGGPGDILKISLQILTTQDFLASIPLIKLVNAMGINWVTTEADITGYTLSGDDLEIHVTQPQEEPGQFSFDGATTGALGFNAGRTFLEFTVTDIFGDSETLRVFYNGHDAPYLGMYEGASGYRPVLLVSFDDYRLRFVVDTGEDTTTTLYLEDPSPLYTSTPMHDYSLPYDVSGYDKSYIIDQVTINRALEQAMAASRDNVAKGRVGAEIAYTVATQQLGLQDVIINEVSSPGNDLHTVDNTVMIQARFLQRTAGEDQTTFNQDVTTNLSGMVKQLGKDFANNDSATTGYVIFSYLDSQNNIHTIILEVLRQ